MIHLGTDPLHVGYGPRHSLDRHYGNYPERYHYRPYRPHYNAGHYYHGYRPIYYPGCGWYSPWYGYGYGVGFGLGFGYSYASVYSSEPYVVHVYDDEPTVYYHEQTQEVEPTNATYESNEVTPLAAPSTGGAYPAPDGESYQPLPATQPNSLVGDGNAAFTAGRYEDARRLYTRAVMADERDGYVKMLLGWASFAVGDFDGAAAAIRRALLTTDDLVTYPMDVRTFYPDAAVLNQQIDALAQHSQSRPDDREAEFVLAYLYYSVGQAERSASMLTGLVNRDRNDTLAATVRDAAVRAAQSQSAPAKP